MHEKAVVQGQGDDRKWEEARFRGRRDVAQGVREGPRAESEVDVVQGQGGGGKREEGSGEGRGREPRMRPKSRNLEGYAARVVHPGPPVTLRETRCVFSMSPPWKVRPKSPSMLPAEYWDISASMIACSLAVTSAVILAGSNLVSLSNV